MNFLSDQAVRELRNMRRELTTLSNVVRRLGVSGPRLGGQVYATLGSHIEDGGYNATEAINGGDGGDDWSNMTDGRTWGDGSDDISRLYAIDSTEDYYTGTHPAFKFSDGTDVYWCFIPTEPKTQMSITSDSAGLKLVNDEGTPDTWDFYGKNDTTKGWHPAQEITFITKIQIDTTTKKLQTQDATARVFDLTSNASWSDVPNWEVTDCSDAT